MAKTLADMTAEERADCVGMWCDNLVSTADNPKPVVLACVQGEQCWILHTDLHGAWSCFPLGSVSPRFDLPRAWTPDGLPVPGEWEDGHVFVSYDEPDPWIVKDTVSIEGLSEGGMSYYEEPPNGIVVELDRFGEGEGKARRWVGEWEKNNEC